MVAGAAGAAAGFGLYTDIPGAAGAARGFDGATKIRGAVMCQGRVATMQINDCEARIGVAEELSPW